MKSEKETPLVTFALFAYNQEKYIREAVEGAFAQTYQPLEIILSDDCSQDKTFEIIEEMAKAYKGPHKIVLNRNEVNLGLIGHLNKVARMAGSEIIVVAAGDDRSFPWRASTIVKVYLKYPRAMAIYSDYRVMNQKCEAQVEFAPSQVKTIKRGFFDLVYHGGGIGAGATYSYRRECFTWPEPLPKNLRCEDRVLPMRGIILGEIVHILADMIDYRILDTGMSNILLAEKKLAIQDPKHLDHIKTLLQHATRSGRLKGTIALVGNIIIAHYISSQSTTGISSAFCYITKKWLSLATKLLVRICVKMTRDMYRVRIISLKTNLHE